MNVGTARGPLAAHSRCVDGKARRLLMAAGRGGAAVVVAGVTTRQGARVSRVQGQGRQRDAREVLATAAAAGAGEQPARVGGATAGEGACRKMRR